jgi:benzoyl-CoA reductase subunit C
VTNQPTTPLNAFRAVTEAPLSRWQARFPDHRPLGMYNAYLPEELFQAAGLTPVYVFHRAGDGGRARTHLPNFTCWPGRSLVDQALSGELDGLAGMALAQTCDTVQALTDIWRQTMPHVPLYHLAMPVNLATPAAHSLLLAELQRLRRALGHVPDGALRDALTLYERTRLLMARLYERAADLLPTDLYAILRAALLMPKAHFNPLLARFLDGLPPSPSRSRGPRLIVVGPHLADPILFQVIEAAGGRVADDFLDVGRRRWAMSNGATAQEDDPLETLTRRMLSAIPAPTKHHPGRRRDAGLLARVGAVGAAGVIFARQKFCDPHGFDYAVARTALQRRHIPHLLLELEQTPQPGQLTTRVEAFVETIAWQQR